MILQELCDTDERFNQAVSVSFYDYFIFMLSLRRFDTKVNNVKITYKPFVMDI